MSSKIVNPCHSCTYDGIPTNSFGANRISIGSNPKPGVAVEKPGAVIEKPAVAIAKPGAAIEKPAVAIAKPGAAVEEPAAAIAKPGAVIEKPAVATAKPGAAIEKPVAAIAKPGAVIERPAAAIEKPGAAIERPGAVNGIPVVAIEVATDPFAIGFDPFAIGFDPTAIGFDPTEITRDCVTRIYGARMTGLLLTPAVLSLLVLAAHFSRHDVPVLPWVCVALPLLLIVRRPWVPRVMQLVLVVGAIEWLRTTVMLVGQRMDAGDPWLRMAVILIVVALVAAGSALLLETRRIRRRYAPR
jgi:hypothetical protein